MGRICRVRKKKHIVGIASVTWDGMDGDHRSADDGCRMPCVASRGTEVSSIKVATADTRRISISQFREFGGQHSRDFQSPLQDLADRYFDCLRLAEDPSSINVSGVRHQS